MSKIAIVATWLLFATTVNHTQCLGYALVLKRHPKQYRSFSTCFGSTTCRGTRRVQAAVLRYKNDDVVDETIKVKNQPNVTNVRNRITGGDELRKAEKPYEEKQRLQKVVRTKSIPRKNERTSNVFDTVTAFFETVLSRQKSLSQRADKAMPQQNNSTRAERHIQSYLAYTFGSEDDRKTLASQQNINEKNHPGMVPLDPNQTIPSQWHYGVGTVVRLFQSLMQRNSTTVPSSFSRKKSQRQQHYDKGVFVSFVQRFLHRNNNATTTLMHRNATTVPSSLPQKKSQQHYDKSAFVSFVQRLLHRNNATSSSPHTATPMHRNATSVPSSLPKKKSEHHYDKGVFASFVQRLLHRNNATNDLSQHGTTSNSSSLLAFSDEQNDIAAHSWDAHDNTYNVPVGTRWAISAKTTNFTGRWKPIVSAQFKRDYDAYLHSCGQSLAVRTVCLHCVGLTREEIWHQGNSLVIRGTNPVGVWERTLVASGSDLACSTYEPLNVTFLDPDKDLVHVEAWWECNGTVHKSWLRGKQRVRGGVFESTRYLLENASKSGISKDEKDGSNNVVLVCESVFHPNGGLGFSPASVTWKFELEE